MDSANPVPLLSAIFINHFKTPKDIEVDFFKFNLTRSGHFLYHNNHFPNTFSRPIFHSKVPGEKIEVRNKEKCIFRKILA